MTQRKRGPVVILALLMTLTACGGTHSSATLTSAVSPLVKGEFVGDAGHVAAIGLSTNGHQVIAYLCNGTAHHVSLEQWFKGPVTGNRIDITNAHGARLVATVGTQAITGTVTLADGYSSPFTARLLPPGSLRGLYRSEETFHGVHYLGGFILNRRAFASPPAQAGAFLAAAVFPLMIGPEPEWRGGILNERTGALIAVPPMNSSPPMGTSFNVPVPGVGTFLLTQCHQAQC